MVALLATTIFFSTYNKKCAKTASSISVAVLKNFLVPKIESVIDKENKTSHSGSKIILKQPLSSRAQLFPVRQWHSLKPLREFLRNCQHLQSQASTHHLVSASFIKSNQAHSAVQSGGKYNLNLLAGASSDALSFDTIICSLGARFKVQVLFVCFPCLTICRPSVVT